MIRIQICLLMLLLWPVGALASVARVTAPGPAPASSQVHRFTALPTWGRVPQADYSSLLITHGEGVITGGPLSFGPALSGIMDFSGPDQEHIMAFLESSDYLERSLPLLSRFTHAARPNTPRGVHFKRANMVDLWPQHLWVIETQWMAAPDFAALQRAAIPEPTTVLLFGTGGLLLLVRRRRQA